MQRFTGRRALVTGASRGIGRGCAVALAREGADVAVHGRDAAAVSATAELVRTQGRQALQLLADLTDEDAVDRLRADLEAAWGAPDVVVACAGGSSVRPGPVQDITPEQWRREVDDNLTSVFLTLRAVLPGMERRGSGVVVTVSSTAARLPDPRSPAAYAAAKAGVEHLTALAAAQAGPSGVRVCCVSPETVMSERNQQQIPPDVQEQLAAEHPLRRLGTVEDVAAAVAYLASDDAGWVSGTTLTVAGGAVRV
ncbi:SDR family NAD(P)-dependent oxidoreductase [Pseudokineococcus basanitobsidens]|uniref:SDR family NAD(P)-dependent oxidoreductase n=1 Tax=Pseudokineococcus basanitobsidens TaxID=1926649 RepID=A0ABU8RLX4_9ACTN